MYTVYSKPNCPQCVQVKNTLTAKEIPFEEIEIDVGQPKTSSKQYCTVQDLKQRVPNAKSVPQIFLDNKHIGGYNELKTHLSR